MRNELKRPELLAPAGDWEQMEMALAYGADAIYLAGEQFGMRAAARNFPEEALRKAATLCRERGAKLYVTCNTTPRNGELPGLPPFLELLEEIGADGVITADLGVFAQAGRLAPHVPRHISTQAGITNYESARVFHDLGARRVILARELSLEEIREIRDKTPADLELECFVHGAMCVSWSGRCLLSNYLTGRDANRGACAQPCRYRYALVEEKRPGEYFPVLEDGEGTQILNSKDLCMVDHIPELLQAGVHSLKIEGRMKSAYYTAAVTSAYRHAVDAALADRSLDPVRRGEVDKVSHREYCRGFYFGDPGNLQYYPDSTYIRDWDVVARVESCDEAGRAILTQRNRFFVGETLELLSPDGQAPARFTVERMENGEGEEIQSAPHAQMELRMKLPRQAPRLSLLRRQAE